MTRFFGIPDILISPSGFAGRAQNTNSRRIGGGMDKRHILEREELSGNDGISPPIY